jgi:hypothetical protein
VATTAAVLVSTMIDVAMEAAAAADVIEMTLAAVASTVMRAADVTTAIAAAVRSVAGIDVVTTTIARAVANAVVTLLLPVTSLLATMVVVETTLAATTVTLAGKRSDEHEAQRRPFLHLPQTGESGFSGRWFRFPAMYLHFSTQSFRSQKHRPVCFRIESGLWSTLFGVAGSRSCKSNGDKTKIAVAVLY